MTQFQERLPNDSASLIRRIEALERQVQQAQAARRLEAATIGRGGITIQGGAVILKDTAGHEIARMGIRDDLPDQPDGQPQPGFILRRNDGSVAFTLDDPNPAVAGYRQLLKMQDAQGHIIFSEDYLSGWGLASPTFSIPVSPLTSDFWPGAAPAAGVWQGVLLAYAPAWNPTLEVGITCTTSTSGTTGTCRLLVNGTIFGSPSAVATFTTYVDTNWTVDLRDYVASPGDIVQITVEVSRAAGTGKVQANPTWVYGRASDSLL